MKVYKKELLIEANLVLFTRQKNKKNGIYVIIKEINKEKYFESIKSYFNEEEIIK